MNQLQAGNKMRFILSILILLFLVSCAVNAQTEIEVFELSPLCDSAGTIICPVGFEAGCADDLSLATQPKCIFYGNKYISGCLKFIGIKKIDLNFEALMLTPSSMIEVIGGGETYTLNREIVGCKKL